MQHCCGMFFWYIYLQLPSPWNLEGNLLDMCRRLTKVAPDGMPIEDIRPYLMDLGSTNGTYINSERLEAQRYYELLEKVPPPPISFPPPPLNLVRP